MLTGNTRALRSCLEYISPAGNASFITAFQRVASVSSILWSSTKRTTPFFATFQEGCFILTNRVDAPVNLPIQRFSEAASISTNDFKSCVEAALLANVSIYDMPVHHLRDDFSSVAIHNQCQNTRLLQPLISKYWMQLLWGAGDGCRFL
jgi:hypothetical protein